jgi:hypothetical protein
LALYFSSDRNGADHLQVFVSRRPSVDAPWGQPTLVPEIPQPPLPNGWVSPGYLSTDGCRLYYYAAVEIGGPAVVGGAADLWVATRSP